MTVAELLRVLDRVPGLTRSPQPVGGGALDGSCTGVTHDSRRVARGAVFVALLGLKANGAIFAPQAIAAGASAIVAEAPPASDVSVPWIVVDDARLALAWLSAEFFAHPSRAMKVVGITGTNGKTTTSFLTSAILDAAGIQSGLMGTVTYRVGDRAFDATRTTPEAPDLQSFMRGMVDEGCGACVMEVSSHALALKRVDGIQFAGAVFTNLTRDHLDFHADMEDYFAAKRRLFELLPDDAPAVINIDDPRGATLVEIVGRPLTYGINKPADVSPGPLSFTLSGLDFEIRTPRGVVHVRSKLVGKPNVYNILAAVGTARLVKRNDFVEMIIQPHGIWLCGMEIQHGHIGIRVRNGSARRRKSLGDEMLPWKRCLCFHDRRDDLIVPFLRQPAALVRLVAYFVIEVVEPVQFSDQLPNHCDLNGEQLFVPAIIHLPVSDTPDSIDVVAHVHGTRGP